MSTLSWIATPSTGLAVYTGGSTFLTLNTTTSSIPTNNLTSLSISDLTNDVWFGSLDSGLVRRSGMSFSTYNISNSPIPDNLIQSVQTEKNGTVWIGTQTGGLIKLDENLLLYVTESPEISNIKCYPTIADEILNIDFGSTETYNTIKVFDITGKEIISVTNDNASRDAVINVSGLNPGVYTLKANLKNSTGAVGRFIKN